MDWNDFDRDATWIDKFTYYLDQENSTDISRDDLISALAVAVAMYCDEYQNTCMLEDRIVSCFGEDALAKMVEDAIPEDDVIRFVAVGEALNAKSRASLALEYLRALKKGDGEDA